MILSIDCGSSNHKVALYDESLDRLAACSRPVVYITRENDRAEFDVEKTWRNTVALIHEVCGMANTAPVHIRKIALTSQAQTFTALDKGGRPRMPFISWMDCRARSEAAELAVKLGNSFHKHGSFPGPVPQLQLAKLLWLRRNDPELLKDAATIVSLPGFLSLRLAGINRIDDNLAAMSGLYSLSLNDWWPAALEAVGLKREQLGGLVKVGTLVPGQGTCRDISFSPRLGIVFAGNDQTAGACANAVRADQPALTFGTALVVYRYAGKTRGPYHQNSCWGPYPGGGYYELTTRAEGCAALDWAVAELTGGNRADFMKCAESAPSGKACFFPQRMGTASAWTGAPDLAARARSVLEGICFSARNLIEAESEITIKGKKIVVMGGGSQSPFWLRIVASVLNCPVILGRGDALLGAALMARPGIRPPVRENETAVMPDRRESENYGRIYRNWRRQVSFSS